MGGRSGADRQRAYRARRKQFGGVGLTLAAPAPQAASGGPQTPAERMRAYRARLKAAGLPDPTQRNHVAHKKAYRFRKGYGRPFVGCDGEGAGTDPEGRQNYMLFRMGERELFTGKRLTTLELLRFISEAPQRALYVGFSFNYDATMILRDLIHGKGRVERLFDLHDKPPAPEEEDGEAAEAQRPGLSSWTWYREFNIQYQPGFRLRIVKVTTDRDPATGRERRTTIPGSERIIYDVFGLFQESFEAALEAFDMGGEEARLLIARNKRKRKSFAQITPEIRAYCAAECDLLAKMMEKFRENCEAVNLRPRTWDGAGKLSKALHRREQTPNVKEVDEWMRPFPGVMTYANHAYYGGRFEVTRTGHVVGEAGGPIYEYDLNAAFAAAMANGDLPCLRPGHGDWTFTEDEREIRTHAGHFIASVGFRHRRWANPMGQLGGLPIRFKPSGLAKEEQPGHGRKAQQPPPLAERPAGLAWPLQGNGVYWGVEIHAAEQLGAQIAYRNAWLYHQNCNCRHFDWMRGTYEERVRLGKGAAGRPLKFAMAGAYGVLAQRLGQGRYKNLLWAGLVTATVRAQLNRAVALAEPGSVVMLATDAVYTTRPLPLDIGPGLGQWAEKQLGAMFVIMPGFFWDPTKDPAHQAAQAKAKRKTRGVSSKFFEEGNLTIAFERLWADWLTMAKTNRGRPPLPTKTFTMPIFVGLRLALKRGDLSLAGKWIKERKSISFNYSNKRESHTIDGQALVTSPMPGAASLYSVTHADYIEAGGHEPWDDARRELEAMPDFVDLSRPWEEN